MSAMSACQLTSLSVSLPVSLLPVVLNMVTISLLFVCHSQTINICISKQVRWRQSVGLLDTKLEGIVGDTLVGAAAVAYLGAFTAHYR